MYVYRLGPSLLAAIVLTACSSQNNQAPATINVAKGPTSITQGQAKGADDITVRTPYFTFAVANGEIVDLALREDGKYGNDLIQSVGFIPGDGKIKTDSTKIVKQTPEQVIIETKGSWEGHRFVSQYEVGVNYPGIKLTTKVLDPINKTVFAGYRLQRNEPAHNNGAQYNDMERMVQAHWTSAQLQSDIAELYETDDLRASYQLKEGNEYSAWLSAGSLGKLTTDKQMYTTASPQAELGLFNLQPTTGTFENYVSVMRQRWNRGERVYLNAGPLLKDAKNNNGKIYAYTPNGSVTADFASAATRGHSFVSFGPEVYPITTNFGGDATPFNKSEVEFRSKLGLANAEVWLDGEQVAGWKINGAKWFRTAVPVPPKRTWMQWIVEDIEGNKAYSNPIWIK